MYQIRQSDPGCPFAVLLSVFGGSALYSGVVDLELRFHSVKEKKKRVKFVIKCGLDDRSKHQVRLSTRPNRCIQEF